MAKLLYIQTSGPDTPERLYAIVLGMTAAAMDIEAFIFFMIRGIMVVKRGEAEKIQLGTFPALNGIMDQAIEAGVRIYVSEQRAEHAASRHTSGRFHSRGNNCGCGDLK